MASKKHLKDSIGIIIGGVILIIWGSFISIMPDSYVYSIFEKDSNITIHPIENMSLYDWTERKIAEHLTIFTLFVVNYLISTGGILMVIIGLVRERKPKKEITK